MRWSVSFFALWTALGFCAAVQAQTQLSISTVPATVSFSYEIGATALPTPQTVQIKRTPSGTALDFTATVPSSAPWLIVTPLTGKTGTAVNVRVNPTSLLTGTYVADVSVSAPGVSTPATLVVLLVVKNPPPTMAISASALLFTFTTDQVTPVAAQTVDVSTDGEPISFTTVASGGSWLSVTPTLGITVAGSPVTLTVSVITDGLLPGSYTGKVLLNSTNAANKSSVVSVALTVTPGKAVISSIWPNAAPVGASDQTITIRGSHLFKASVVQAGTTTLTTTWISPNVTLAVIPKASLATQGALTLTITNSPQPASDPATFTVTAPGPQVQSVVNAASFVSVSPRPLIAPGEILSIFGSGLGPGTLTQAAPSGGAYPTSVGSPASLVEFEITPGVWTAAPIIFAHANQINAVAPFALPVAQGLRLRVTYNSLSSAPVTFDAVTANPGLFTIDSSGRGQAAALNYDSVKHVYSLNSASNPAAKGSIVVLFGAGGGVTSPLPSPEGQVIPSTGTPPNVAGAVAVTIGGDGATVQSATSVPGSIAGLMQLNLTVPTTIKSGKDIPVVVTIGGQSSTAYATLAVK